MTDSILEALNLDGVTVDPAQFDQFWREIAARGREWLEVAGLEGFVHEYLGPGTDPTALIFAFGILLVLMIVSLMVMLALMQDREPALLPEEGAVVSAPPGWRGGSGGEGDRESADPRIEAPDTPGEGETAGAGITVPVLSASDEPEPEPKLKSKAKPKPKPKLTQKPKSKPDAGDKINAEALANIEAEMLTLKEMHARGHISSDEYIAESRALYDRARLFR